MPPFRYLLPGFLLALVASASGALLVARSFARPLKRLTLAARRLGAGDLSARTGLVRPDEFGEVSRAFDEMATRLGVLMRAQQELLANVSHELRTPLARIRAALDFASEADGAVLARAVQDFNADVRELERLVSDVLQTARLDLEAGRIGPHLPVLRVEPFELASLVRDAAERFASRHPSRRLVVEQKDVNLTLTADPMLIRRAVDNVIDNAVWYSDASTEVTLKVEVAGDEVRLSVVDRGIGIAPEDLPRLTEPFFRTDPSRARRTGGLGLGLSLTQRIVDAHGGTLSIESELGKGTTVHITLPVGEALARVALGP